MDLYTDIKIDSWNPYQLSEEEGGGVLRGEARIKHGSAIALETADREVSRSHR